MATQKVLTNNAGTIIEVIPNTASSGTGDAGKLVALNSAGQVDITMMPTGIGPDTATINASEALSAGAFVNVWNSTGAAVRNADATTVGKETNGFVLAGVLSGAPALVYFSGINNQVSGQTPGPVFLTTTPGVAGGAPPSGSGNVVQRLGIATSATSITFEPSAPIVLA